MCARCYLLLVTFLWVATSAPAWAQPRFLAEGPVMESPSGSVGFCKRHPDDCKPSNDTRIELTPTTREFLRAINVMVNSYVTWVDDLSNYDREDYWSYPVDEMGDCEDITLEKKRHLVL